VRLRLGLVLAVVAALGGCAGGSGESSPPSEPATRPDIDRTLRLITREGAPGAIVLLRNRIGTWRGVRGFANADTRVPIRASDRFRVGSVTKTFTAAVVLQLVDEGRVRLDDTVEQHLPGVLPYGRRVTLRRLLNHTSGIFNVADDPAVQRAFLRNPYRTMPPRAEVAFAARHPLSFPPGSDWAYSNTGYQLLGLVVERVTANAFGDEVERRIFRPLRLHSTTFEPRPQRMRLHAYVLPGAGVPLPGGRRFDSTRIPGGAWADGAIVSTLDDLATFYRALFTGELVPRPLLRTMMTLVHTNQRGDGAGLGVFRTSLTCGQAWGHDGSLVGYETRVRASRDGTHIVIVAVNAWGPRSLLRQIDSVAAHAFCQS
jgi:D-alanyl-D-alanine carboxypeptidase